MRVSSGPCGRGNPRRGLAAWRRGFWMAMALVLLGPAARPSPPSAEDSSAPLPDTLQRVWYTTNQKNAPGRRFRLNGDLKLGQSSLDFDTGKRTLSIPMDQVHTISFGRMRRDVDTDWAVLAVGKPSPTHLVGFRDGRKLGFGQRTGEIYEAIKGALERAAAAQYDVPAGFSTFEGIEDQLTLALPEGWEAYLQSLVFVDDRAPWGTTVFSSRPVPQDPADRASTLQRVLDAAVPSFFLDRREAGKRTSCKGLSAGTREELLASASSLLGSGATVAEAPRVEPVSIGGCSGLRILASGTSAGGAGVVLDLRAVAQRDTLFVFGQRRPAASGEEHSRPFDAAVGSMKFSAAQ